MRSIAFPFLAVLILACVAEPKVVDQAAVVPASTSAQASAPKQVAAMAQESAPAMSKPPREQSIPYCQIFPCQVCQPSGCPSDGVKVSYCCELATGDCGEVADGITCPDGKFKVICNWGVTNADGTFTCFD